MTTLRPFTLQRKQQWFLVALFVALSVAVTAWWLFFDGLDSLQSQLMYFNQQANSSDSKTVWLAVYALVCIFSQLLIVPSGSLILMAAGFIFSPIIAAGIFSVAQVLCSWPVYRLGTIVSRRFPDRFKQLTQKFKLPGDWHDVVQKEGFYATVVLRLTPVIPSAAACLIASGLGIRLWRFIPATMVVCWIRPLFFASLGGSLQTLAGLPNAINGIATLQPLILAFFAAVALLLVKIILHYKSRDT